MWDPATDFGQVLTPATIETYLNDTNSIRQNFVQSNQRQVDDLYRKIGLKH